MHFHASQCSSLKLVTALPQTRLVSANIGIASNSSHGTGNRGNASYARHVSADISMSRAIFFSNSANSGKREDEKDGSEHRRGKRPSETEEERDERKETRGKRREERDHHFTKRLPRFYFHVTCYVHVTDFVKSEG